MFPAPRWSWDTKSENSSEGKMCPTRTSRVYIIKWPASVNHTVSQQWYFYYNHWWNPVTRVWSHTETGNHSWLWVCVLQTGSDLPTVSSCTTSISGDLLSVLQAAQSKLCKHRNQSCSLDFGPRHWSECCFPVLCSVNENRKNTHISLVSAQNIIWVLEEVKNNIKHNI